jgi:predicted transposase/invertase (TIGR01784 family)
MVSKEYVDHDRLFKELIQTFFKEFLLLYYPEIHEQMDFSHTSFLSQEIFTDITVGEKRAVDLLIETKLKGEDGLIIVHIEPQSYEQIAFYERMFIYFSRLYEKYRRKIIPIAIFAYDKTKDEPQQFNVHFPFLNVLTFNFFKVELKKCNWREFVDTNNPVAAALLSKMGYSKEERVQVKLEFLRMLTRLELNPAKMKLITGFFETYLQLEEKEEENLVAEIKKLHPDEEGQVIELMTSWERKGLEKGREEGREEGIRNVALKLLRMGMKKESVVEATGLSLKELEELKRNM